MHRRAFVTLAALGTTAMAVTARRAWSQTAKGGEAGKMVDPKDPLAVQLGYVEDASKVNKAKFPQYRPEQKCGNCQLYIGTGRVAQCTVFGERRVPAAGWCSAWAKKV